MAPASKASSAPKSSAPPVFRIGSIFFELSMFGGKPANESIYYNEKDQTCWTGGEAKTAAAGTNGKKTDEPMAPFTPGWLNPEKAKPKPKVNNHGIAPKKMGMQRIPAPLRGPAKMVVKVVLGVLDILASPWAKFPGRDHTSTALWSAGSLIMVMSYILWECASSMVTAMISDLSLGTEMANNIMFMIHAGVGIIALGGVSLICGGIRLNNGKSFQASWDLLLNPPPAFLKGPTFNLGRILVSLKDLHTNIIAFGGVGTGKCLDPNQDVLMYDGTIKKVKDVRSNDWLMGPDSKPRRVLSTTTGYGPLYRITPIEGAGKPWICNDVHVMTLKYTNQTGTRPGRKMIDGEVTLDHDNREKMYKGLSQVFGFTKSKTLRRSQQQKLEADEYIADVPINDFIARKAPSRSLDSFWKLFRTGVEFPERDEQWSEEEFYLGGVWLGDGATLQARWTTTDPEIKDALNQYAKRHERKIHHYEDTRSGQPVTQLTINGKVGGQSGLENLIGELHTTTPIKELLSKRKCKTPDKDIPHQLMTNSRSKRIQLLAGLMDSDGHYDEAGHCFDFSQKRKHLTEKTVWLARSLGLRASETKESWKECKNRTAVLPNATELLMDDDVITDLLERAETKIEWHINQGELSLCDAIHSTQKNDLVAWCNLNDQDKKDILETPLSGEALTLGYKSRMLNAAECLLNIHRAEPRERYWRTTISGDISIIPTRVARKKVKRERQTHTERQFGTFQKTRRTKDALVHGWDAEPIGPGPYCGFTLDGDGRFLLGDFTVTHNTASIIYPLLRQFCEKVNVDDPDVNCEDPAQKFGGLILDEKGDFIDFTLAELHRVGRSINDVIILDPDLEFFRYNPIDDSQSPAENANKLALVQSIIGGGGGGGENKYWDDTSKSTIVNFLTLFKLYKGLERTGLDDIAKFVRDDAYAQFLVEECEKKIEAAKAANQMSFQDESIYMDAVSNVRNNWLALLKSGSSTGQILKTTIANMLGPLAQDPKLQRVFCRDRNFTFKDVINEGKIVMFRSAKMDKSTKKLIAVCLKLDYQTWMRRRNGSTALEYGLNTNRTCIKLIDEYQEFVTPGDEEFYGVSRSAKCCAIVATQSISSLLTAYKRDKERTDTLIQNLCTKIFLRTTDGPTQDLGEQLAGQSRKENLSTSVSKGGLVDSMISMNSSSSGPGSISVSEALEQNFRKDAFGKLMTVDGDKSSTGPYYSEAILYHYHDTDALTDSRCYRTDFPHLYYSKPEKQAAAARVLAQSQSARAFSVIWYRKRCFLEPREKEAKRVRNMIDQHIHGFGPDAKIQLPENSAMAKDVAERLDRERTRRGGGTPATAKAPTPTGAVPVPGPAVDGGTAPVAFTGNEPLTELMVDHPKALIESGIVTAGQAATLGGAGSLLTPSLDDRPDQGDPRNAVELQKAEDKAKASPQEIKIEKLKRDIDRKEEYLRALEENQESHPSPANLEQVNFAKETLEQTQYQLNLLIMQQWANSEGTEEPTLVSEEDSQPIRLLDQGLEDGSGDENPDKETAEQVFVATPATANEEPAVPQGTNLDDLLPSIPDGEPEIPGESQPIMLDEEESETPPEEQEESFIFTGLNALPPEDEKLVSPSQEEPSIEIVPENAEELEAQRLANIEKAKEIARKATEDAAAENAGSGESAATEGETGTKTDSETKTETTDESTKGDSTTADEAAAAKKKLDEFFFQGDE